MDTSADAEAGLLTAIKGYIDHLCIKASCAASQAPLLAAEVPAGLVVATPRRTAASLEWLLGTEAAACNQSNGSQPAGQSLVGLCALLVSETSLVHYTPRPRGQPQPQPQPQQEAYPAETIDEKYWKRRYNYFARFDEGIRMDAAGWFEVTPESVARHIADRMQYDRVVDGTCGVGGNAIQFAINSRSVIAVDTDAQRLSDAKHNAGIYGVADRMEFVHDDFAHFALTYTGPPVDAVFLSPPWGGPAHLDAQFFSLRDVKTPDIVHLFAAASKLSPRVVLYLPRHTDLNEVAILAARHGFPAVEVEKVFFQHPTPHLKLVVAYFGPEVLTAGIPRGVSQKTVGPTTGPGAKASKVRTACQLKLSSLAPSAQDLLSPMPLAGPLMRALYCRHHYVGRYIVRIALDLEQSSSAAASSSQAGTCERKPRGKSRSAASEQLKPSIPKASKAASRSEAAVAAADAEVRWRSAKGLCQALGSESEQGDAGLASLEQLLAELPLADSLRLASAADAEACHDARSWSSCALKLAREQFPEAYRCLLERRKAEAQQRAASSSRTAEG